MPMAQRQLTPHPEFFLELFPAFLTSNLSSRYLLLSSYTDLNALLTFNTQTSKWLAVCIQCLLLASALPISNMPACRCGHRMATFSHWHPIHDWEARRMACFVRPHLAPRSLGGGSPLSLMEAQAPHRPQSCVISRAQTESRASE